jgi:hypothetical protein
VPTAGEQNKIVPFLSSAKGGSINKNRVVVKAFLLVKGNILLLILFFDPKVKVRVRVRVMVVVRDRGSFF